MCQNCVDKGRLSRDTYNKIGAFLEEYPKAEFGPAHIVLSDDNVFDGDLKWCIGLAKAALSGKVEDLWKPEEDKKFMDEIDWYRLEDEESAEEWEKEEHRGTLEATVKFLEELLLIPEDER